MSRDAWIRAEVPREAIGLGLPARPLDDFETASFRRALHARYPLRQGVEWPYDPEQVGLCEPYAWRALRDWPKPSTPVYLFFPGSTSAAVFEMRTMVDLVEVVNRCITIDEFRATGDFFEWLFSFNDHDCLIARGSAIEWLRGVKRSR